MKNIRIFIGSDIHNIKAERALIYSILKNTSSPVEFIIMSRFGNERCDRTQRKRFCGMRRLRIGFWVRPRGVVDGKLVNIPILLCNAMRGRGIVTGKQIGRAHV